MNAEQQKMLIEVGAGLKSVTKDLEGVAALREEIRGLPTVANKVEEIYHALFVGDGEANPPLTQKIAFVEKQTEYLSKKVERLASARTLGPRERVVLYTALIAAIGGVIKHYLNGS